jgi:hypothetical protein
MVAQNFFDHQHASRNTSPYRNPEDRRKGHYGKTSCIYARPEIGLRRVTWALPMNLLHISDIHFRSPDCLDPDRDPDRPYRTKLIQDVRAQVAELGPVGATLVGGDIAFKGSTDEYETALIWIRELAAVAGCPLERITGRQVLCAQSMNSSECRMKNCRCSGG